MASKRMVMKQAKRAVHVGCRDNKRAEQAARTMALAIAKEREAERKAVGK